MAAPREAPDAGALPIAVRRARPDDREAVVAFSSDTFGGWDYVPDAWPAWVEARDGVLLVATPQRPAPGQPAFADADGQPLDPGRPVAVARVALLSAEEAWLEGLRVNPSVRGRSVATTLQVAELRWAKAHGVHVSRYFTGEQNEGSHRLGARHGFRRLSDWRSYGPRQDEGGADRAVARARATLVERLASAGLALASAESSEVEWWWSRVETDPTFAAGNRLYEWRVWALQELTPKRFAAHVRGGHVLRFGNTGSDREWALAIVSLADRDVDRLHLALLVGEGRTAFELARETRHVAGEPIRLRLPDPGPPLLRGLADGASPAGFTAHGSALHVFERSLRDADPLPAPDAPHLLVYEEEPRRVAVPPPFPAEGEP